MEETKQTETMYKTVIHCKTKSEFNRIMKIYNMDEEFMDWDFFKEDTVLYPLTNQYGDINGYSKEANYRIIESENL